MIVISYKISKVALKKYRNKLITLNNMNQNNLKNSKKESLKRKRSKINIRMKVIIKEKLGTKKLKRKKSRQKCQMNKEQHLIYQMKVNSHQRKSKKLWKNLKGKSRKKQTSEKKSGPKEKKKRYILSRTNLKTLQTTRQFSNHPK